MTGSCRSPIRFAVGTIAGCRSRSGTADERKFRTIERVVSTLAVMGSRSIDIMVKLVLGIRVNSTKITNSRESISTRILKI
ncbi:hypothetical protein [Chamaesiphon sp.]|uniref:hypothetical protein n=1 Tax=Chamaesiphon sp. TaxID=2814140 RepID=UPI003593D20E